MGAWPAAPAETAARPVAVPECLGVNIHFTDPLAGEMEMLAGSGVRWVRTDLIWRDTEREPGQYDFSAYERLLAALKAHGIGAMLILNDTNPLYDGDAFPHTDLGREACARWAAAAIARFRGRGVLWEMWNEPNIKNERGKAPDAGAYARLALTVAEAVRSAAPEECFIGPATSLIDLAFLETCFRAGLLSYWSAVTVHPYRFKNPETVIPEYRALRALIDRHAPQGRPIPVIQGEWGWASSGYNRDVLWFADEMDDGMQGRLLARQWLTNLACSIPLSIWYDWRDDGPDPGNPEHNCGMVRHAYHAGHSQAFEPKPAYLAARTLAETLRGCCFDRRIQTGDEEEYVLVFRRGSTVRYAAWAASGPPRSVRIPVEGGACSVVGHLGEAVGRQPVVDGRADFTLTDAPIYIVCQRGGREKERNTVKKRYSLFETQSLKPVTWPVRISRPSP